MHKVDQTVLDAIGIYEASCEAAGAPISAGAKVHAVMMALSSRASPEEVTGRLMQLVDECEHVSDHNPLTQAIARERARIAAEEGDEPRPARKPRAKKGAK